MGWSAPSAPQIVEQDDSAFWITQQEFAWVVAMMSLGAAFSCVISGIIRSKIGTRWTVLLFGIPITIGWSLITFSLNPAMVSIQKVLPNIFKIF